MADNISAALDQILHVRDELAGQGCGDIQFAAEFVYLLFLKILQDNKEEQAELPVGFRWSDLRARDGVDQQKFYRDLLLTLSAPQERPHLSPRPSARVMLFYTNAASQIKYPKELTKLILNIDLIDWFEAREAPNFLAFYEQLLERSEKRRKTKAQDYFTPRVVIRSLLRVLKPSPGETIQDPACGVGGFIVEASRYIRGRTTDLFELRAAEQYFHKHQAFTAVDINPDKYGLLLINCTAHGVQDTILSADSLSSIGATLPKADLILCNPPFSKFQRGQRATRDDFTYNTGSKQLCFLQHIYRGLKPGGRAAVMVPDNVLFENKQKGLDIRRDLMNKCALHTILRLPESVYPGKGTKINVLFFTKGHTDTSNTKAVWVYDMRTNMATFGPRNPLLDQHFSEFESCYGEDPNGGSQREDQGPEERFRVFSREKIRQRGDNLDITWLGDNDAVSAEDLKAPEFYADAILKAFKTGFREMCRAKRLLVSQEPLQFGLSNNSDESEVDN